MIEIQSADANVVNLAECGMVVMNPLESRVKKRRFLSRSIFVFFSAWFGVDEYSHERMAKKRAPVRSCPIALLRGFEWSLYIAFHTIMGRQDWCLVGGSSFL